MSVFKVFKDNGAGCAPLLHLYAIEFALFSSKTLSFYSVEFALSSESSMNCVGKNGGFKPSSGSTPNWLLCHC